MKNSNGAWVERKEDLNSLATEFFKELYTKDRGVAPFELIEMLPRRVTEEMNTSLTKEFTEKEISDALFQIGPLKAPGPDGFPVRFFQLN